jgi:hypothetical protein
MSSAPPQSSQPLTPEVKKARGVYYTPTYIVDYIVKHTVGKLLEGRTVKWIARDKRKKANRPRLDKPLRILDPACGSGSFLLGAYQYLLRWYLDYYTTNDPEAWATKPNPAIHESANRQSSINNRQSSYRLSIAERKRILLDHVYGVDIDPQAVEVTKLSLLLKVLEGESQQTLDNQLRLFHERALPDLAPNIKCGNSLIGPDFYDNRQMTLLDEDERYRINVFDWHAEFPGFFRQNPERKRRVNRRHGAGSPADDESAAGPAAHAPGSDPDAGFDAVIGNPPYLSFSGRQAVELSEKERSYFAQHYQTGGWMTAHGLFIERAVRDLSKHFAAFIVPDQVGHLDGYGPVREMIGRHAGVVEVCYWGEAVFQGVVTPALTFVADRAHRGETLIRQSDSAEARGVQCEGQGAWAASATDGLLSKLRHKAYSLGALVADPGVHTGNCSKKLVLPAGQSQRRCVPVLEGKQVSPYACHRPSKVLRLDYQPEQGEYFTIRARDRYADAPFVIRQTAAYPIVGPREHADYFRNSLLALYPPRDGTDVRYLVGLLNSRLIRHVYRRTVQESQQKAFPQVKVRSLRQLPIRKIDLGDPKDKLRHDRMVELVQQMLDLHKQRAAAKTPQRRGRGSETGDQGSPLIQPGPRPLIPDPPAEIDATGKQIDRLACELYDLTDDEIRIVEEATR